MREAAPPGHNQGMSRHRPDTVEQPCVGDVILLGVGASTVYEVGCEGRTVKAMDPSGGRWRYQRADDGAWVRLAKAVLL